jgi:hypothetical protein
MHYLLEFEAMHCARFGSIDQIEGTSGLLSRMRSYLHDLQVAWLRSDHSTNSQEQLVPVHPPVSQASASEAWYVLEKIGCKLVNGKIVATGDDDGRALHGIIEGAAASQLRGIDLRSAQRPRTQPWHYGVHRREI